MWNPPQGSASLTVLPTAWAEILNRPGGFVLLH